MWKSFSSIAAIALLASGCTVGPDPKPGDAAYAPVAAPAMLPPPPNQGGIYRASAPTSNSLSLFEDSRAHRIGDIITVVLTESTTSSKKADTSTSKTSDVNLDAGIVLGAQPKIGGVNMNTAVNADRSFDGSGSSDQSNNLRGTITVMVADVLPNGLLEVRGEKWMALNRGEEFIRLRGYVRPDDVLPDNSVLSTRVADVRITYAGKGELADANNQGWMSRFFNSKFWPF